MESPPGESWANQGLHWKQGSALGWLIGVERLERLDRRAVAACTALVNFADRTCYRFAVSAVVSLARFGVMPPEHLGFLRSRSPNLLYHDLTVVTSVRAVWTHIRSIVKVKRNIRFSSLRG